MTDSQQFGIVARRDYFAEVEHAGVTRRSMVAPPIRVIRNPCNPAIREILIDM